MLWKSKFCKDGPQVEGHFSASTVEVNSASVEERETVVWNFVLYALMPPASITISPVTERL